ncbi:enoyl-CoA hydratase/isomerase family protein [Galbibacter sp. BG1]|uniref:enoyl-CoA hydratase/isomerase family protein n=1 Tax=Galbibacter sp. BG1 TaxID=1170699 RepID=UPI0015C17D20|nr:enoyl-CoA hydratase/isomerase family protein [Galbibacter sp. BG1]QLE02450.1 enoyl-CoA hydratase/isomerase family protein [Galbibacter sp. BG1]
MSQKVLTSLSDGVFSIVLNYPEKLNCLGFEMLYALENALQQAQQEDKIKVVLIKGAGDRAFCSGANIKEFEKLKDKEITEWIELGNKINNSLECLKKPTVAFINGYAMGGGLELALACDFRIASSTAIFAFPEVSNGWLPGWGGMARATRLIGEVHAKKLILLSERVDAVQAQEMKLIHYIKNENEISGLLSTLSQVKPMAYAMAKSAIMDPNRTTYGSAIDFDVLAVNISNHS